MSSENADRPLHIPNPLSMRWLDQCSPWRKPAELAEILLEHLTELTRRRDSGCCWFDSGKDELYVATRVDVEAESGRLDRVPVRSKEELASLLEIATGFAPHLQWRTFGENTGTGGAAVFIGLPDETWDLVPQDDLFHFGRVFGWALEYQRQLLVEKLESLAEYAAGAGHEINNPLGSIIGRASQLLRDETDPERRRSLENIGSQAYRIRDMIGDTMLFGRPPAPAMTTFDPVAAIQDVAARFTEPLLTQNVVVDYQFEYQGLIKFDSTQFAIVMSELIRNSIHVLPNGGRIDVRLERQCRQSREGVSIEFSDDGPGFTDEQKRHCFDPFYSGRQAGRGLGFGLSKCWQILRQHSGVIELIPSAEKTLFRLWIPVAEPE